MATRFFYLPVHVLDLDDLAKSSLAKGGQDSICNSEELKLINSFERWLVVKLWEGKKAAARGPLSNIHVILHLKGPLFCLLALLGHKTTQNSNHFRRAL
jgi:hypothetical protein